MTWLRSPRRRYLLLLTMGLSLGLVVMLILNGPPPMAKDHDDDDGFSQSDLPQAVDLDPHPERLRDCPRRHGSPGGSRQRRHGDGHDLQWHHPGPEIRLKVGDKVIVHFTNNLPIPSSIHWHGVELTNRSDGTGITQDAVPPGGTFTYDFIVPRAGVFFYHSHIMPTNPSFKGYYGSIIVVDPVEQKLLAHKIIPSPENTWTLVLGDTTVCKEPGFNDTERSLPIRPGPSPGPGRGPSRARPPSPLRRSCARSRSTSTATSSLPPRNAAAGGGDPQRPADERLRIGRRAGVPHQRRPAGPRERQGPGRPRWLAQRAGGRRAQRGVHRRERRRGHPAPARQRRHIRYFRLRLTDQTGNQITLFRIGGQGGILDNVRMEGGIQGTSTPCTIRARSSSPWPRARTSCSSRRG